MIIYATVVFTLLTISFLMSLNSDDFPVALTGYMMLLPIFGRIFGWM